MTWRRKAVLSLLISGHLAFVAGALYELSSGKWNEFWHRAGIDTLEFPFTDLRSTPAAVDALNHGIDPYIKNQGDPLKRPFNYPPVWIALFSVGGITQDNVPIVAIALIGVFSLSIGVWVWHADSYIEAGMIVIGSLCYGARLAIERGNTDLLIFSLMTWALQMSTSLGICITLGVAALLKVYPVFALTASRFFIQSRRLADVTTLIIIAYYASQLSLLSHIRNNTPVSGATFGIPAMAVHFADPAIRNQFISVALLICLVSFGLAFLAGYRWTVSAHIYKPLIPRLFRAYIAFGALYVGVFLFNSNFDYRLIFLIPTLPLYCYFLHHKATRLLGTVGLVATIGTMNLGLGRKHLIMLSYCSRPLLAGIICFYFGVLMKWKREDLIAARASDSVR